jgi:outer membrane protein assembly factor BamE
MTPFSKRAAAAFALAAAVLAIPLAGCSVKLYKIDVQQGNVVTQEMIAKLRSGMTRQQVKYVLGTPLVADAFHPERWDYFYKFDKAGNPADQRRLTLVFKDDQLDRVIGDVAAAPDLMRPEAAATGVDKTKGK